MMEWLSSAWSKIIFAFGCVFAIWFSGRQSGKSAVKQEQNKNIIDTIKESAEVSKEASKKTREEKVKYLQGNRDE